MHLTYVQIRVLPRGGILSDHNPRWTKKYRHPRIYVFTQPYLVLILVFSLVIKTKADPNKLLQKLSLCHLIAGSTFDWLSFLC